MLKKIIKNLPFIKRRLQKYKGPDQYEVIQNFIGQKIIAIDVGSNDGRTIEAIRKNFTDIEIIGFEPTRSVFNELSLKFNRDKRVHLYNLALSDIDGEIDFWTSSFSPANSALRPNIEVYKNYLGSENWHVKNFSETLKRVSVQANKFDTWKEINIPNHNIDLLKTDTQGYDHQVLLGAIQSLSQIKFVLIELQFDVFYESSVPFYETVQLLYQNGFVIVNIFKKNNNKIAECDALFVNKKFLNQK